MRAKALILLLTSNLIGVSFAFCLQEADTPAKPPPDLATLLENARAARDGAIKKGEFKTLPNLEAEWAAKIEASLKANPDAPGQEKAWPFLVELYGGATDAGAKIRNLYDRAKVEGADKPWFEEIIRLSFYQLHKKDHNALVNLLADAEKTAALPEAKAAALYYHGEVLMEFGDGAGAKNLFARIGKEHPSSSLKLRADRNIHEIDMLQPGKPAPDFKIPKVGGGEIHLAALKGKVVLLVFWTHWAPLLRERAKRLAAIHGKHQKDPFVLVGVALDEARDSGAVNKAIADHKMAWSHGFDRQGWKSPVAGLYNVKGVPRSFLIDPKGVLLAKDVLLHGTGVELRVSNEVTKRKAELQKALEEKKKKEEAAKKAKEQKPKK